MTVEIDEDNLAKGVIGLVVTLAEILRDALRLQAIRRIDSGGLTEEEIERLGKALLDLDAALVELKEKHGIAETVQNVRDNLDKIASDALDPFINPKQWAKIERNQRSSEAKLRNPPASWRFRNSPTKLAIEQKRGANLLAIKNE